MTAHRHLLLICPLFFGYHSAILDAAKAQGFKTDWVNVRAWENTPYKAALKGFPGTIRSLTQHKMRQSLSRVENLDRVTDILIIKGDGMSRSTLDWLRGQAPEARVSLYFWDSIRNNPGAEDLATGCDHISTFDPIDARRFQWPLLPLFSRMTLSPPKGPEGTRFDWCFVGTIHGDRYRILDRVTRQNPGLTSFVHAVLPGRVLKIARAFRDPSLLCHNRIALRQTPLTKEAFHTAIQAARAVLDIEHPSQSGLTMRTLETLLSGTKLITTNPSVRDIDLFHPSRVFVLDRQNPRIDPDFLTTPFASIPPEIGTRYEIGNWLNSALRPDTFRPIQPPLT